MIKNRFFTPNVLLIGLLSFFMLLNSSINAQTQLKKWYLNGQEIDFSAPSGTPLVNDLPASLAGTTHQASNGIHNEHGALLFYLVGNTVFASDGSEIGNILENTIGTDLPHPEIAILAVPGSSCKFFIVYAAERQIEDDATGNITLSTSILFSEIDMTLNNNKGGLVQQDIVVNTTEGVHDNVALAVSPLKSNNTHFLYIASTVHEGLSSGFERIGRAEKYVIDENGVNPNPTLIIQHNTPTFKHWFPKELDLSHDGSMIATASNDGAPELLIIHLNPITGNLNPSQGTGGVTVFPFPETINGTEFHPTQPLIYLSRQGLGVSVLNWANGNESFLTGSNFYDNSQIELAYNGRMYAVRSNTQIGEIDINQNTFSPGAIPGLNGSSVVSTNEMRFSLPDQIDGFDYNDFFQDPDPACCGVLSNNISTYNATSSDIWNGSDNPFNSNILRVATEIRVSNNSTLRLQNLEVQFLEEARIVVEIGSRLIVDGTVLTASDCESIWAGIQIWGDSDDNQSSTTQGTLILRNHSVIEHARAAVRMYSTLGGGSNNTTGGILYANDTDFINNRIGIQFNEYQNFSSGNGNYLPNQSYIRHCDFTINDDYRFTSPMYGHIRLWGVDGIAITNCNFSSEQTDIPSKDRGYAIRSNSASFSVSATCTEIVPDGVPCPGYHTSSFSGFDRAIWAFGNNQHGAYTVNRASFDNNLTAIYSRGVNNPTVIKSTFDIGSWFSNSAGGIRFGIHLDTGTGYTIEQNDFAESSGNISFSTVGVYAYNTGSDHNQIYNNSFTDLTAGNYANRQNRENPDIADGPGGQGLRYLCNQNSSNLLDFYVRGDHDFHGIATNQGVMSSNATADALRSAGNTFSHNGFSDFRNLLSVNPVIYWSHPSDSDVPTNNLLNTFVNNNADQSNGCADNFPDGGNGPMIILTDIEYQFLSDQFDNHKTEVGNLQTQWSTSIDNGSTTNLVSTIENWQGTGSALKTDLLNFSPHLSTSALIATLSRSDILNNDDLFDILIQNPDELRKGFVANQTGTNTSTSTAIFFPPGKLAALEVAAQQDFTVRSETEAFISGRKAAMSSIADKIIRSIMADYDDFDADLYREWLSKKQSFESELAIIESVVRGANPSKATILLDDLEQNGNLNTIDQQVFDSFRDIIDLELLLISENRTWYDLDSTEINELEMIADSDYGIATAKAKGILSFFFDYYFESSDEDLESLIQQGASGYSDSSPEGSNSDQVQSIRVYPTPARDQVTIQFESPLIYNSLLTISNLNGEVMKTSPLMEGGLQFQISTKELPVGIFYYQVVIDGENKTGKILISK